MNPPPITDVRDCLRLARTQNVGPVTFANLIARFGSAAAALDALPKLVQRGGGASLAIPSAAEAEDEIAILTKMNGLFCPATQSFHPA